MDTSFIVKGAEKCLGEYRLMTGGVKSIKSQLTNNYQIGKRLAQKDGYSTIPTITGSIFKKTKITKDEVPSLAALIGTFTPIPGGSVIGYLLARIATKII